MLLCSHALIESIVQLIVSLICIIHNALEVSSGSSGHSRCIGLALLFEIAAMSSETDMAELLAIPGIVCDWLRTHPSFIANKEDDNGNGAQDASTECRRNYGDGSDGLQVLEDKAREKFYQSLHKLVKSELIQSHVDVVLPPDSPKVLMEEVSLRGFKYLDESLSVCNETWLIPCLDITDTNIRAIPRVSPHCAPHDSLPERVLRARKVVHFVESCLPGHAVDHMVKYSSVELRLCVCVC